MQFKAFILLFVILLIALYFPQTASAAAISLTATDDSFVMQSVPSANLDYQNELAVGTGGGTNRLDSYIKFDLSSIPANAIITNATLNLTVNRSAVGGYAGIIRLQYIYNSTWYETGTNNITYNNQPNNDSEFFHANILNSTRASAAGDKTLFDVRQYVGWWYSQNRTNISFFLEPQSPSSGLITYFNSSETTTPPRLEIVYAPFANLSINASKTMPITFKTGMNVHFTNTTEDRSNLTTALAEMGGKAMIVIRQWDIFEPNNATPLDTGIFNWSGFIWDSGREDEYYNGEWHNGTVEGAISVVKNVNPASPPVLVIKLVKPPAWIKNSSTDSSKYYPLRDDAYTDVRYAWKILATFAVVNMSYPANKVVLAPINEPYGTQDTSVGTQAERYKNFAMMMQAARDAANEVNTSIRTLGFLDNDPDQSFTRDFFAQNSTWGNYFDILTFNTYLHSDPYDTGSSADSHFGYSAWNTDASTRPNFYRREWEVPILKRTGAMADTAWEIVSANATNVKEIWQTETADKWLAYNNVGGSGTKIFNETNDALWWSARFSVMARERWNTSVLWALIPFYTGGVPLIGWGFMESYQKNWTKYEAYNVSKFYNSYANGLNAINDTTPALDDNQIFASSFLNSTGRQISIFLTNHRAYGSNISLNITNLPFKPNIRQAYGILNGSLLSDENYTSTAFDYTVGNQTAVVLLLREYTKPFMGIRNTVFSDGSYNYNQSVSGKTGVNAAMTPSSNNITVEVYNWSVSGNYYKRWNESSQNASVSTSHILGDFPANTSVVIKKNGVYWSVVTSNSSGYINFTYSGGYSEIQFEASSDAQPYNITACQDITVENTSYILVQNISSAGTCFNIMANNVTLDGQGYTINYSQSVTGYAINNTGYNFTTVKNLNVVQGNSSVSASYAIFGMNMSNSAIMNNNITTSGSQGYGIFLYSGSNSNNVTGNHITTSGNAGMGLTLYLSSNYNTLSNNTVATSGPTARGITLTSVSSNAIIGGSLISGIEYDYRFADAGATNNFVNTNFTAPRIIWFNDATSWFNYNNETNGNIWLKTNVSTAGRGINRTLMTWSQATMKWNDTNVSGEFTSNYNITGLYANANYGVYNTSGGTRTNPYNLTTDVAGNLPAFTIALNGNTEINALDITPPEITLISPANTSSWSSSSTVAFSYNVSDNADISNCSLLIDGKIADTSTAVTRNTTQTFTKSQSNGNYNWSVQCYDSAGNRGESNTTYYITVIYTAPSNPPGGSCCGGSGGGTIVTPNKTNNTENITIIPVTGNITNNTNIQQQEPEIKLNAKEKIDGLLARIKSGDIKAKEKLDEAEAAYNAGDYAKAYSLASDAENLIGNDAVTSKEVDGKNWLYYVVGLLITTIAGVYLYVRMRKTNSSKVSHGLANELPRKTAAQEEKEKMHCDSMAFKPRASSEKPINISKIDHPYPEVKRENPRQNVSSHSSGSEELDDIQKRLKEIKRKLER